MANHHGTAGGASDHELREQTSSALSNAAPQEVQQHRNALGEMLDKLSERGVDISKLAENAGISTTDIDELSHDDVVKLTTYILRNHLEVINAVADKFPATRRIIDMISPFTGMLNQFFERGS